MSATGERRDYKPSSSPIDINTALAAAPRSATALPSNALKSVSV
jgi:hypothetical protein